MRSHMHTLDSDGRRVERSPCQGHQFTSLDPGVGRCRWCGIEMIDAINEHSRARAIRAVVAAQWGVACELMDMVPQWGADGARIWQGLALLPTAEQIVDGGGA